MKKLMYMNVSIIPIYLLTASCNSEAKFASPSKKSLDSKSSQIFNFTSSSIVDGNLKISDGGRYTSFDVTQAEKNPSRVTQMQVNRKAINEPYEQGHAAKTSSEEFNLSEAGMLDFLVVIDDSRSMDDEQALIAKGLAPLISEFKDTNWQIAVISMSDPCVKISNLIKKTDANADAKFAAAVKKPYDPDATEQGFPMAIQAFKGQCKGALRPWLRAGSSVGVLFLSDEDNCGSNPGEQNRCQKIPGKNAAEMVNYLHSIRTPAEARIYAITDHDGTCPDAGGQGFMYAEAARLMGGSVGSICHDFTNANGYGTFLNTVSTDAARLLKKQFLLSSRPDMTQFDVTVDGQVLEASGVLSIEGKLVKIDPSKVNSGLKITFNYTHDAIPMFSEVPAQPAPNLLSLVVTVNGTPLTQEVDYHYDPVKRVIGFTAAPPEDAKVVVKYLEEKTMKTHFENNLAGVRPDTLKVSVNGVPATDQSFSYDSNGIDFIVPPTDGAVVTTSWQTDEHKILNYAASSTDPRHVVASTITDKASGQEVAGEWKNPNLQFKPENVVEKRVVTVTLDFGEKSSMRTIDLPDDRIDDNVKVTADGKADVCQIKKEPASLDLNDLEDSKSLAGKAPEKKVEEAKPSDWSSRYKGKDVSFQCAEGNDFTEISIDYRHEIQRTNKFVVTLAAGVDPNDKHMAWKVFVDGKPTTSFKRTGAEIEIEDNLLPPETKVDIEVISYN